jgi:SPP1 gp7 family putative phage head morphogenesis protein
MFDDLDRARDDLIRTWEALPVNKQNGRVLNRAFYEYLIDLDELARIVDLIRATLSRGNGRTVLTRQTEASYRAGIAKAVENLARLSDDYTRTVTQHLASQPVLRRAALAGARVFEFMEGFAGDTASDLGRVLFQAVQDGQNPKDTAKDIRARFDVSKSRAERIARTEITQALRRGRIDEARDAEDKFGIRVKMLWVSALIPERSRPWHMARHGNLYTTEEVTDFYSRNGNAINCILPGARVAGQFVAGSKAYYDGPAVKVMTAGGNSLSVTPNHPMMTNRGLVKAAEIVKGDYLVAHCGEVENLTGVSALNSQLAYPTIEQVFGALVDIGHASSARVGAVDFHGDSAFMQEDINIVNANGVLSFANQAATCQLLRNLNFVKPYSTCFSLGAHKLSADTIGLAASGDMSGLDAIRALIGAKPFTLDPLSITGAPDSEATFLKPSVQANSTNPVFLAEAQYRSARDMFGVNGGDIKPSAEGGVFMGDEALSFEPLVQGSIGNSDAISDALDGFSGLASFDEVTDIEQFTFTGHVYDLQDVSGLMVADNIVVSNCLCSQTEITIGPDGEPIFGDKLIKRMQDQKERIAGG